LVSVISTGSKGWDLGLGISSGIVILASGVYLIRKNEREEEERQRKQKEEEERQNQKDNIKRQLDEMKREEDAEADLFKQEDKKYIDTLSPDSKEKLNNERREKQENILQIIQNYKNKKDNSNTSTLSDEDLDKISLLIINSMIDKNAEVTKDFFKHYNYKYANKYAYLIPIKTLDNEIIIDGIIRNINEYNSLSEFSKFIYRKRYEITDNTKNYDYAHESVNYSITR
jgi:hypothetical protein